MRWMRTIAAAAALLLLAAAPGGKGSWTRAWTASMWQGSDDLIVKLEDATIRSEVRVAASGGQLRLRLANDYGPALVLGGASVRIKGKRTVRVTFNGGASAKIPAGAPLVSDPIPLAVSAFDLVEVSIYMPGSVSLTTVHEVSGQPTSVSSPGDHTMDDFVPASTTKLRPLIAGLDVLSAKPRPIIVAFGDSITDNGSCPNAAVPICRWSDALARRLARTGNPHVVVTQAISGNRILSTGSGPSALARLDRDVLAMPGVTHLVLLEGINDIGNSGRTRNGVTYPVISAADLIYGYYQLAVRAHERGIKVIGLTILPFEGANYHAPEREAIRVAVNDWMRTSGTFDAVIDMEKVVADPANPKRLASGLQTGDNLHPDGRGETAMGEAIDLRLFR